MISRSSNIGLLLSAILALSVYTETTSAVGSCPQGQTFVSTAKQWRGPGQCAAAKSVCANLCAGQRRPVVVNDCDVWGFFKDWWSCSACCVALPPSPPPPALPPPPAVPTPPPRPAGDLCGATERSFSEQGTTCTTCVDRDCDRYCLAWGETATLNACNKVTFLCSCCCAP